MPGRRLDTLSAACQLFDTLITAALADTASWTENFGDGQGSGELSVAVA